MSQLFRSALSARISKLPDLPHHHHDEEDDGDDDESTDSLSVLPGLGMSPPAMPSTRRRPPRTPNPEYTPISAATYFSDALQVSVPSRKLDFRVYYTPPAAAAAGGTVMVCHHGAGYSGLSFACFAREVADVGKGECGVLAVDARRHGRTLATATGTGKGEIEDEDLSIEVLVDDFTALVRTVFPDPKTAPTLILIGHSMGGSVVVRSSPVLIDSKYRIAGVAVLDVVEGSAVEALPHMHALLNARPEGFQSVEDAIEWHVNTKTIRNPQSARVSIPSVIVANPAGPLAFRWRTPLRSTAPYWLSWFQGLSRSFLATRAARLLVLAGTDRLDNELMIGQMQGRFQLVVVPGVGHMVQEDDPTRLAEVLVEFWKRHDRVVVGVKKVGDL